MGAAPVRGPSDSRHLPEQRRGRHASRRTRLPAGQVSPEEAPAAGSTIALALALKSMKIRRDPPS